ncbi:hypothetical protein [Paraburkholderia sp. BCC1886]|uniref:hypothetical protein n=1 Tax=Paraburkholderia sp. BCC1886 TaxID=2562670 RepID=UPI0016423697|nr:hypothetical protein [Paraburkholderia sp. BCC1886]
MTTISPSTISTAPDTRSSQGSACANLRSTAWLPMTMATSRSHSSTTLNIHVP